MYHKTREEEVAFMKQLWAGKAVLCLIRVLTVLAILCFVAGIAAIIFGKISVAGVIWAVTALLSFSAYDLKKTVKKK